MKLNTAIIERGFNLASDFLSYLREKSQHRNEEKMAELKLAKHESEVLDAVREIASQLDIAVSEIVKEVTKKIEKDQWEKLVAQVKGVQLALDLENTEMLQQAVGRITEQIEYAKNRLSENKIEWLGPWLMAESIRLVAIGQIATTDRAAQLLERETRNFRISILDLGAQYLLSLSSVPWLKIAEFVDGRSEDILRLIATESINESPIAKSKKVSTAPTKSSKSLKTLPSPPAKSVLNPAAAWPFPTGSKRS